MDPRITLLQRAAADRADVIGLSGGLPADELMPRTELARALDEVIRRSDEALQYGWPEGEETLRKWIAKRLAARGAAIDPDTVIITSGAQQALSLVGAAHRGERISVGDATYPAAITAFRQAGARVTGRGAAIAYVMPGVANPTGVDVVEGARPTWLAHAELIADEAYSELRFDGRISRALVADAPDRVWHIGTFSKTLTPGLRVGWLVPPRRDHDAIVEIKAAMDLQTASLTQQATHRLLAILDYDAHVAKVRAVYERRASCLAGALRSYVQGARFADPAGGFSIWVETDDVGDELALLEAAVQHGVCFDPGSAFQPSPAQGTPISMRLSFSNHSEDTLVDGVRRLSRALTRWRARLGAAASHLRS